MFQLAARAIKPSQRGWPVIARVAVAALVAMIVAMHVLARVS
jgi:hypothetical protein